MKRLILGVATLVLSSCATVTKTTRIHSSINAVEYNSVSSNYLNRPTFVSLDKISTGDSILVLVMDMYGYSESRIHFSTKHVSDYKSAINKYLDWAKIAKSRGEAITKEIARVETWGNGGDATVKFVMHSGNIHEHYLVLTFCAVGTCLDQYSITLDEQNSIEFAALLDRFAKAELEHIDTDQVYK